MILDVRLNLKSHKDAIALAIETVCMKLKLPNLRVVRGKAQLADTDVAKPIPCVLVVWRRP